ncbi:hypothetical protein EMA8858_00582 [Emticicia aquatica]|uniref:DUF4920 domain-containing protein n=1 Tax=Emticicia aquatica TaxID=1681835 RepID=A0ABM9ALN4_9BACT|nr:DUF4920 domain-containing protein [Emticicia aquatica]CAH0994472.1 hypothetical protein EMA8858_00582 [Emticicia aquatica]
MKKTIALLAIIFAVNISFGQKYDSFGEKIKPNGAITTNELVKKATEKGKVEAKVSGVVESVCQVKGCWMKVKLEDGQTMRVTFKDYGFFVPKDIAGKTIVFEGNAATKTTSVDELRHYAVDAGKSKDDVAKITEPKTELTFEANGVLVPKN